MCNCETMEPFVVVVDEDDDGDGVTSQIEL